MDNTQLLYLCFIGIAVLTVILDFSISNSTTKLLSTFGSVLAGIGIANWINHNNSKDLFEGNRENLKEMYSSISKEIVQHNDDLEARLSKEIKHSNSFFKNEMRPLFERLEFQEEVISTLQEDQIKHQNSQKSYFDRIHKWAERMSTSKVSSKETHIKALRKKWFGYYVSENANGSTVWMHWVLDLSGSNLPGLLNVKSEVRPPNSNDDDTSRYYEQWVHRITGSSSVIIESIPLGHEEFANVMVFPVIQGANGRMYGITVLQGWSGDSKRLICPVVLSTTPMKNWTRIGQVSDKNTVRAIYSAWLKHMDNYQFLVSGDHIGSNHVDIS
ncbi:MAG: hypothetical protein RIF33_03530 [Cyclobacteriaceae bacterium]